MKPNGWSVESPDGILTADEARKRYLEPTLADLSLVLWRAKNLDGLNEDVPTVPALKVLGYMNNRDELIERRPSLWAELPDDVRCEVLYVDDEDIETLTRAAIDAMMAEYDETV